MGGGSSTPQELPKPVPEPLLAENWRPFDFHPSNQEKTIQEIRNFKVVNPEVRQLHILVHGPIAAGKSSFICSIANIFKGRMTDTSLVDASGAGHSFTKKFITKKIRDEDGNVLPFVISDIMGLEDDEEQGARAEDLVMALKGHLKDGYSFNPRDSLQKEDPFYNSCPTLNDQVHCLVSILPGDKISLMTPAQFQSVTRKLREIRKAASAMGIPQVIVMTKVDEVCPEVNKDLKMIYRSKRIKEKMQECTNRLGVPMKCVFPVKNYHQEIDLDNNVDTLLLSALKNILHFANDHLEEELDKRK